ncbi:MAG: HD domain-containing protein [Candidatus Sericytochromatia bacterium]|nr:HD domain-containing protein [Candidatus Sericytochromatia bacterium]
MLRPPFVLRDVIHATIDFPEDALGAVALDVLQTRPFQRLRRLHQLGLSKLIFPGAEHSRFAHSLGAYQLVRRAMSELDGRRLIDDMAAEDRMALGLAAMLHDLGHGIFSHTAERIWGFHHETVTDRLILEHPDLSEVWSRHAVDGPALARRIVAIRHGGDLAPEHAWMHDLVSSQADVDRLDYLLRDAYMTGVRYAGFDLDWLMRHLTRVTWRSRSRIAFEDKAVDALGQVLMSRLHMYKNVYEHRTARIYDAMLHGLMLRLGTLPRQALEAVGLTWLVAPMGEDLEAFVARDDYAMWEALKILAQADIPDPIVRELAADLLSDQRWDGDLEEVPLEPARWVEERFRAPYARGRLYVEDPEAQILLNSRQGVRPLSEDPRGLRLQYAESPAMLEIRRPARHPWYAMNPARNDRVAP